MFTVYTPLAQVLTVVAEEPIAVFSKPGACPPYNLCALQTVGPCGAHPYRVSVSEARERSLFHRSPAPVFGKGGIVHDGAAAHVDTVMRIGETRRNEVRAQRRLFISRQRSIASAKAKTPALWSRHTIMTTHAWCGTPCEEIQPLSVRKSDSGRSAWQSRFGRIASDRHRLDLLFGHIASAVGRESRLLLLLTLGTGLKDQVDECTRLERQELATGINQVQAEFLRAEFREHRPQDIRRTRDRSTKPRAIVPSPCRLRR